MLDSPLELLYGHQYFAKASIDLRLSAVQTARRDYVVLVCEDVLQESFENLSSFGE